MFLPGLLSRHWRAHRRRRRGESPGSASRSPQAERIVSPKGAREFSAAYSLGKFLGRGSYGVVRECISRRTGRSYACKVIRKDEMRNRRAEEAAIRREVKILQQLVGHPHVVSLVDVFEDRAAIFVVMEKCNGGELYDLLCEITAGGRANQSADDPGYFKDNDAHSLSSYSSSEDGEPGDSPTDRVSSKLCCFPLVKLADFGSAISLSPGELASGVAGSRLYQAPEVLQQCKYGFKADMWSLGVILFSLLSGSLPFMADSRRSQARLAKKGVGGMDSSAWEGVSPEAKDLVTKLLAVEPDQRPCAEEVLKHPWVVQYRRQPST
ncbi:unnamed protein product [Closterium sp. Yama58-4]|nr:unnamed protein product [Closterium sp. Yama58-4]